MQSSNTGTLSRRSFVGAAGGAVALGLAAAGGASADEAGSTVMYSHVDAIDWDDEYDVVVIGYGGAGSVAAITAHEAGAKVLITDKAPLSDVGGNTRYAEQYMFMPDSYETGVAYYTAMSTGFDSMTPEIADFMSRGTQEIGEWVLAHGATTFSSYVEMALGAMGDISLDMFADAENGDWYVEKSDGTIGMTEYPIWCDGTVDDGRTDISYMVDAPDDGQKKYWNTICFNNIEALAEEDNFERWVESPAKHLIQDPFTKTILGVQIEHDGELLNVRALKASSSPAAATRPVRRCSRPTPSTPSPTRTAPSTTRATASTWASRSAPSSGTWTPFRAPGSRRSCTARSVAFRSTTTASASPPASAASTWAATASAS